MKLTCVLCGRTLTRLQQMTDICYQPNGEYSNINPIPKIQNATPGYGFCKANGCAQQLGIIVTYLKREGANIYCCPVDTKLNLNVICNAINYCERRLNNIPDPAIKSAVSAWILNAKKELVAADEYRRTITDTYNSVKAKAMNFFTDYPEAKNTFLTKNNIWFAYDKKRLFIDCDVHAYLADNQHVIPALSDYSTKKSSLLCKNIFRKTSPYLMIPIEHVIFFKEVGQVQYSTNISGGKVSGGGVNLQGAVVGAALFGTSGAIIGSNMGTDIRSEGIKSTTQIHDNRQVTLRWNNENNRIQELSFDYSAYEYFMEIMPEKEYSFVSLNSSDNKNQEVKKQSSTATDTSVNEQENCSNSKNELTAYDKIKKFKELLDLGIITEDEFNIKKKELLDL